MHQLNFLDPDDGARDKVHIGRHGPKIDLVPLFKPNCDWRLGFERPVPGFGFWDDLNRLRQIVRVRIEMREYGEDDIESRLLHNQARAGELHHRGVGRGAWAVVDYSVKFSIWRNLPCTLMMDLHSPWTQSGQSKLMILKSTRVGSSQSQGSSSEVLLEFKLEIDFEVFTTESLWWISISQQYMVSVWNLRHKALSTKTHLLSPPSSSSALSLERRLAWMLNIELSSIEGLQKTLQVARVANKRKVDFILSLLK